MNLVEWLQRVMVKAGSAWVLWIMILLSVVSVAIILERAWFFASLRDDLVRLIHLPNGCGGLLGSLFRRHHRRAR